MAYRSPEAVRNFGGAAVLPPISTAIGTEPIRYSALILYGDTDEQSVRSAPQAILRQTRQLDTAGQAREWQLEHRIYSITHIADRTRSPVWNPLTGVEGIQPGVDIFIINCKPPQSPPVDLQILRHEIFSIAQIFTTPNTSVYRVGIERIDGEKEFPSFPEDIPAMRLAIPTIDILRMIDNLGNSPEQALVNLRRLAQKAYEDDQRQSGL